MQRRNSKFCESTQNNLMDGSFFWYEKIINYNEMYEKVQMNLKNVCDYIW